MKLLTILPSMMRGGAEEHALTLASAAAQKGWTVYAAFPPTNETASLVEDFQAKGIQYHPLSIENARPHRFQDVGQYLPQLARTIALLVKLKPDIVQVNLPCPDQCLGSIIACGLLKIPTTVVFHLIATRFIFSASVLKVYAWARARNQQWIAISNHNRKFICESFQVSSNNILLIYNGTKVTSDFIDCTPEQITSLRSQMRQELGLSQNSKLLLTVGRLNSQKGYQDLVPIVASVIREFPEVKFIWVGEGEEKEDLIQQVRKCGVEEHVLFLGYRSDVPRLLQAADLFVFPTYYEGLPFAPIEAMAHSLPIVASDASSLPEILEDKVHALLFPVGNRDRLQQSLLWALRNPDAMQEMARQAQIRAEDFSQAKMIKDYLDLWQKLGSKG